MQHLEDIYKYEDKFSESLFDYVVEDDFIYYLRQRYPNIRIREDVQVTNYFYF